MVHWWVLLVHCGHNVIWAGTGVRLVWLIVSATHGKICSFIIMNLEGEVT